MMQKKPTAVAISDGRPTTTTPIGQQLQARNLDKDRSLQICPRCRHKLTLELLDQRCSYRDVKHSSGLDNEYQEKHWLEERRSSCWGQSGSTLGSSWSSGYAS
ncbi:uncharacterized protein [Solanum lycopersicum]|uniref:uncharacterized protein n=1 Tax=Solanum lycopersicum TaxID=4081 RepID=UPI0037492A3E